MGSVWLLALCTLSAALAAPAVEDACAQYLINTIGGKNASGYCDLLSRDTIRQFIRSAHGVYSSLQPCACGASAIFTTFLFSSMAYQLHLNNMSVDNSTFAMWQMFNFVQGQDHISWPIGTCENPTHSSHSRVFAQLRCDLGLVEQCGRDDKDMKRIMQVWLDSKALDDHTFVIQRAGPDEFYLYQSYYNEYDLWSWIQQSNQSRNYSGPASRYVGRMDFSLVSSFVDNLDELTSGMYPWNAVAPLWQQLFWVEPPAPSKACNVTGASRIGVGVAHWSQDYTSAFCAASAQALHNAWGPDHQYQRDHMCDGAGAKVVQNCAVDGAGRWERRATHLRHGMLEGL